jgi:hypothetical protein
MFCKNLLEGVEIFPIALFIWDIAVELYEFFSRESEKCIKWFY